MPQSESAQHITPPSQNPQATAQPLDTEEQVNSSELPGSPIQHFDDPTGLHLQVDFAWSKFRNTISEKNGDTLTPLYIQHFRPTKPQLRFDHAGSEDKFATGTINNFSISAECNIDGTTIHLKPLKRWKTQYNYLSTTLSTDPNTPAPISWIANMSMKLWDFVCLDENHIAIAKFSVNIWALKQVGNIYFDAPASKLAKEARDEIVVTGTSLLYVMMVRMNNPLHLLGSIFSKPGRVHGKEEEVEGTKDR